MIQTLMLTFLLLSSFPAPTSPWHYLPNLWLELKCRLSLHFLREQSSSSTCYYLTRFKKPIEHVLKQCSFLCSRRQLCTQAVLLAAHTVLLILISLLWWGSVTELVKFSTRILTLSPCMSHTSVKYFYEVHFDKKHECTLSRTFFCPQTSVPRQKWAAYESLIWGL